MTVYKCKKCGCTFEHKGCTCSGNFRCPNVECKAGKSQIKKA